MKIKAGFASRDITPNYPVHLGGYSSRDRKSDGIKEPISAGCAAVADGNQTVIIISVDTVGIYLEDSRRIRKSISEKTAVPEDNIVIAASHTHFAPYVGLHKFSVPGMELIYGDDRYRNRLEALITECAAEAVGEMGEAELQYYQVPVPQVLYNRRARKSDGSVETVFLYPGERDDLSYSPVDETLTVIRFKGAAGFSGALVNFSCHPVTGGLSDAENYKISSDYPYYLRKAVSEVWHCPVLFTLGAAGDAVPMNRRGDSRKQIGESLAYAALLGERRFIADPAPRIGLETVEITGEVAGYVESAGEVDIPGLCKKYASAPAESEEQSTAFEEYQRGVDQVFRSRMYPSSRVELPFGILRIGPFSFACLPFEILSEMSLRLKEKTFAAGIISCANGYHGYLPLEHEFSRGGYECLDRAAHFVPGTADQILDVLMERI
ncbi:MAG: neutral/alkaline non-lysosomal ceramidase N-terminal domain-containing protein [Spirochaetia bacterium]